MSNYQVRGQSLPPQEHPVPILIGGNSPEVHAVAATHGDIVGLAGSARSRAAGVSDYASSAVERQIARLRDLAGARFSQLELQILVQWHEVTTDRRAAALRAARALDVPADVVLESPYALLGTPDEIATQLAEHHDRFGISRWTVFADRPDLQPAEVLVPVIEVLSTRKWSPPEGAAW